VSEPRDELSRRLGTLSDPLALLRGLFEHSPVPYAIFHTDGRVVVVNPAYVAMFGRAPPPDYDLFADEIAAALGLTTLFRRAFAGETVRTQPFWYDPADLVHVDVKDARRVAIQCTLFPVFDPQGAATHVAIAYQDVTGDLTAREQAEQRQREAEAAQQRSEFLAEASALLTTSLDVNETLRQVASLAVPRIADWCTITTLDERGEFRRIVVVHKDPAKRPLADAYLAGFPPNQHKERALLAVLQSAQGMLLSVVDDETLARSAQNEEHLRIVRGLGCTACIMVPILVEGSAVGVVSLMRSAPGDCYGIADLSLAQDLAGRAAVSLRTARLMQELHDAVRTRDDFISVAGHELKTPLAALTMHVQSLLRRLPEGDEGERVRARLLKASVAGDRLEALIHQLLDVSRVRTGRMQLDLEQVDLVPLVREVVERHADAATNVGSTIEVVGDDAVVGRWDPLRLEQIVTNLLGNALKYGRGAPITISITKKGKDAVLRVSDHGIGIDPAQQGRIFERFERAVASRQYGGFGLGLWITREIVVASGGSISVESVPGTGATFTVRLPL
jgi:signal transduction histidine kinase